MNQSFRFSSGGVSSSKVLSDDGGRVFRRRWHHDAENRRIWSLIGVGNSRSSPIGPWRPKRLTGTGVA
jgi:hypothetical protein